MQQGPELTGVRLEMWPLATLSLPSWSRGECHGGGDGTMPATRWDGGDGGPEER